MIEREPIFTPIIVQINTILQKLYEKNVERLSNVKKCQKRVRALKFEENESFANFILVI